MADVLAAGEVPLHAPEEVVGATCVYAWPCEAAVRINRCESTFGADLYNETPVYIGGIEHHAVGHYGMLWPLHARFWAGEPWGDLRADTRAAYGLWSEQGWAPWPFWAYTYC
jgi:hypothetical protein